VGWKKGRPRPFVRRVCGGVSKTREKGQLKKKKKKKKRRQERHDEITAVPLATLPFDAIHPQART
jgi:hypothetical protein